MRRSARLAAAAGHISADPAPFASLPLPLACRIFLALPPDARGRACCVCRAWRDALAEPALWTHLDMSAVFRPECKHFFAVLRGAARRARAQLCELDVSRQTFSIATLQPVLTAYAGSLRELHLYAVRSRLAEWWFESPTVEAVVAALPLLQVLTATQVECTWDDAARVLRAEPPFAQLQLCRGHLDVHFSDSDNPVGGMERFTSVASALADATLQPALRRLHIWYADTALPELMGALVDAALTRRLREFKLIECTPPAAAPLARLLAEGMPLQALEIHFYRARVRTPLFDAAGAVLVADVLRVNMTLTTLYLQGAHLCGNMNAAGVLLGALVGHPSLRMLWISEENIAAEDRSAFGALIAALVAADAPALHILVLVNNANSLGDAGFAPIVEALPLNRHLRDLGLGNSGMSEAFARERLLPAVRANTSLRRLDSEYHWGPEAKEAEELVKRRGQHD